MGDGLQLLVGDDAHHHERIDRRDLNVTVFQLGDGDVAGEQQADFGSGGEGTIGERRVASTQDFIGSKIDVQFLVEGILDIDFRQDTEAFGFEGVDGAGERGVEIGVQFDAEAEGG